MLLGRSQQQHRSGQDKGTPHLENVLQQLPVVGRLLSHAMCVQGLGAVVTDIHKLRSTDQRVYLYASRQGNRLQIYGGLKIGTKKLFVLAVSTMQQCILHSAYEDISRLLACVGHQGRVTGCFLLNALAE